MLNFKTCDCLTLQILYITCQWSFLFLEKAYWLVEECFKKIHDKEMEQLEQSPYIPLQQEREIDGKMDKKKFLQYVKKLVLRVLLICN